MTRIILLVALLLFFSSLLKAQGWRGIRPLHTTRSDVERLIGPPMQPGGITYDLAGERVNVVYSSVPCAKGWPYGWKVQTDTVIQIVIYPQVRQLVNELSIDLGKYRKYVDPTGITHYSSDKEGVAVAVDPTTNAVREIEYFPAASDAHLLCPEAANREGEIQRGESQDRAPDVSYTDSSPEKDTVYLDYLAERFQRSVPNSRIYIIAYAGKRARVGEGQARARRAKVYLSQNLRLDPKQITIIDGGHRDPAGVDLYIAPPGKPKPLSSPTIYPDKVELINGSAHRTHRVPKR